MNLKKTKDSRKSMMIILSLSIIAVLFVPMLYSAIYLGSIWDVYNKLDSVPVAFVNLDKQVTKDGKEYAVGKEVEDNLKDNRKVAWKFVSHEEAMKGVEGTEYYAVIEIPADFSEKIANAQDGDFKNPEIIYLANKGRNFIFSQISERVAEGVRAEVSSSIQEEISKTLVDSLFDVKVSIRDAGDGADELQLGTQKLLDGSGELSNGLKDAAGGSKKLEGGLKQAVDGQEQIVSGAASLIKGLNQLKGSLTRKNESVAELVAGARGVYYGVGAIKAGAIDGGKRLSSGLNAAADGIKNVSDNVNTADTLLAAVVADYKATGSFSEDDIKNIMTAQAIMDGIKSSDINKNLGEPLRYSANSMDPLVKSLQELEAGAGGVADGTATLAKGMGETQAMAAEGTSQLIHGADRLRDGGNQVLVGLNTAAEKTGELSTGLGRLEDGAMALRDGLKDAKDGAIRLRDGLNDGYDKMRDNLKFNSNDMSKFVSDPVNLKVSSINDTKYYGQGFGPYFISMSLWLGAMFISMIITIAKSQNVFKSRFMNSFIGKLIAGSGLVSVQAVILSFVLLKGLGINPVTTAGFYAANIFISVVFFGFMYGISHAIGILGAPVMFIILLLQLSSSGGTFPIESLPSFYRTVGKLIPMTYSVNYLRMVVSGINASVLNHNIAIMLIFMGGSLCGGLVIRLIVNLVKKKDQTIKDSVSA